MQSVIHFLASDSVSGDFVFREISVASDLVIESVFSSPVKKGFVSILGNPNFYIITYYHQRAAPQN